MSKTVPPSSEWSFGTSCAGLSLPLKIFPLHKMEVRPQQIVWWSFPKVCGFRPKQVILGENLLYHYIVILSIMLIQDGLNSSVMFLFHDSSIYIILNKPSSHFNSLFLYLREEIISSNKWQGMYLLKKKVSYMHIWNYNWPPVTPVRYPNPTSHIRPTTNPPYELTKV